MATLAECWLLHQHYEEAENNSSPLQITFSHMFAWPQSQLMWSAVTFCQEVHIRLWGIGYSFGITHF